MRIITADMETFWAKDHTLSKMSPMAYVMHPETELISMAIKVDDHPTHVFFGEAKIRQVLDAVDWSDVLLIGHNMSGFDSMILAWRLGVNPKMWGCTLAMARPIHAINVGNSLGKLVAHYNLGVKDQTALFQTQGKHLADFTPDELAAMKEYNKADVDQCYALFHKLRPHYTAKELWHIDATIRMLVEPKFDVNVPMLEVALCMERDQKRKHILLLAKHLRTNELVEASDAVSGADTIEGLEEAVRAELASAPKFSALLTSLGVETPMKPSPTTPDKQVPALAKTDEGFIALQEHDNELVAAAARARLAVKSTLLETRLEAFIAVAGQTNGKFPVPLNYCGAVTTGRWSGWAYNPQNMPRINPGKPKVSDALRNCLKAPPGHKVVVADLSGIELRVNHFLWKVQESMALYQADPEADLYRAFAAVRYGVAEADVSKQQRQLAKLCLAEGTLILTRKHNKTSWIPVESFTPDRQLWDGKEWVWAKGVVSNGWRQTLSLCGVWLTPDHLVLSGTRWLQAQFVRGERISLALGTGAENLSLRVLFLSMGAGSLRLSLSATVGFLNTRLRATTTKTLRQLGAIFAPRKLRVENGIGHISRPCQRTTTGADYSTGCLRLSTVARIRQILGTTTMEVGAFACTLRGATTVLRFLATAGHSLVGTFPSLRWTASTATAGTSQGTSGSSADAPTCSTKERYQSCSSESQTLRQNLHVYDILDCGPRNRFTILSNKGPLVVHNCQLGLGFGAGWRTFKKVAKIMGGLDLSDEEAEAVTVAWRTQYVEITQGWRTCHARIQDIHSGVEVPIDQWGHCITCAEGVRLPSGRIIRYPALHQEYDSQGKQEWWYGTGRFRARIYAGKATENFVQALARDIVADNAVDTYKATGFRPQLSVHDELVYVVPESDAQPLLDTLQSIMRTPPKWWPELVTWSEGDIADTYGAAK